MATRSRSKRLEKALQILSEYKENLQPFASWMQKGRSGVILFSFGTMAPSSMMPERMRKDIFATFAAFPDYHFIFKADKDDELSYELAKSVGNVDVAAWLPQTDLLGRSCFRGSCPSLGGPLLPRLGLKALLIDPPPPPLLGRIPLPLPKQPMHGENY